MLIYVEVCFRSVREDIQSVVSYQRIGYVWTMCFLSTVGVLRLIHLYPLIINAWDGALTVHSALGRGFWPMGVRGALCWHAINKTLVVVVV